MGTCLNGVKKPNENHEISFQSQILPQLDLNKFTNKTYMKYDQERYQAQPFWLCYEKVSKRIVPLKQVNYLVTIRLGIAECEITQIYDNNNDQIIDIEYMFSINPSAAFCSMDVQMGDKIIHGVIKEKEIAKQEYNEGVKQGKTMAYAEENEKFPDIMKVKLGNLAPKSELKIIFKYVEPLLVCLNKFWRLDISSVIRERYRLKEERENSKVAKYLQNLIEFDSYNPNHKQEIHVIFEEELNFCQSPTHKIVEKQENQKKIIQLDQSELQNLKSFVLLFSTPNINEPQVLLSQQDNDALTHQKYCATITFIPKLNPQPLDDAYRCFLDQMELVKQDFPYSDTSSEYVFLLDRSGSMEGLNIQKATEALILFLRSLPSNCYFNIVSFGSRFELMWEKAQQYSQKSIDEAIAKVSEMEGDMGGTKLKNPLKAIYKGFNENCRQFNIFLLTDGEVYPKPIIDLIIQKSQPNIRVYSLGIGSDCSKFLIEKSAFVGNGKHQFILDNEDLNDKVIDLLEDSITPYLSKIELVTNVNYDTIVPNPQSIISLKKNNRFTVQVLFGEQKETDFQFTVRCLESMTGSQWGMNCQINKLNPLKTVAFHKLAAHKEIKCLENAIRFQEIKVQSLISVKPQFKLEDLIAISTQYQVLCKDTAFICEGDELSDELKNQMQNKVQIEIQQNQNNSSRQSYHCDIIIDYQSQSNNGMKFQEELCCMEYQPDLQQELFQQECIQELEQKESEEMPQRECAQKQQSDNENETPQLLCRKMNQPKKIKMNKKNMRKQSSEEIDREVGNSKKEVNTKPITYMDILGYAMVDGSFKENLQLLIEYKMKDIKQSIVDQALWNTLLSLCCLELYFKSNQNAWNLVFKKGIQFLAAKGINYQNVKQQTLELIQKHNPI